MPAFLDLQGHKYGRLTVISRNENRGRQVAWLCACDCGSTAVVIGAKLRSGHTQSCGCLQRERTSAAASLHKESGSSGKMTKEYNTWTLMKRRCYRAESSDYHLYGGRGIQVCERWRHDYLAFLRDMGRAPTPQHSLDRVDNSLGYSPDNCRWATPKEQRRNQRGIKLLTFQGKTMTPMEWSVATGVNHKRIYARLKRGWSLEKTLTTPH